MPAKKLTVSRSALLQRLKRHVQDENTRLKVSDDTAVVLDVKRGLVLKEIKGIEEYARKTGVLQSYEALAD